MNLIQQWMIDAFRSDFFIEKPLITLAIFVKLLSFSILIKASSEIKRNYFSIYHKNSYLHYLYKKKNPNNIISPLLYQITFICKPVIAVLLIIGIIPKIDLILLSFCFLIEIRVMFKYHVNLLLLICVALLFAPQYALDNSYFFNSGSLPKSNNFLSLFLILITQITVYITTAFKKINRKFISGQIIYENIRNVLYYRKDRHFFDAYYPQGFIAQFINNDAHTLRVLWTPITISIIIIELTLPFLLILKSTVFIGIALGLLLHLLLLLLFPVTFLHFSFLCISILLLFIDPDLILLHCCR